MTPDAEVRRTSLARSGDLAVFAANGFSFASWMSRIPDIRDALDLTPGLLGVLLLSLSAGALIGLLYYLRVIQWFIEIVGTAMKWVIGVSKIESRPEEDVCRYGS